MSIYPEIVADSGKPGILAPYRIKTSKDSSVQPRARVFEWDGELDSALHELGHLRWSPQRKEMYGAKDPVSKLLALYIEDVRINQKLSKVFSEFAPAAAQRWKACSADIALKPIQHTVEMLRFAGLMLKEPCDYSAFAWPGIFYRRHRLGKIHKKQWRDVCKVASEIATFLVPDKQAEMEAEDLLPGITPRRPASDEEPTPPAEWKGPNNPLATTAYVAFRANCNFEVAPLTRAIPGFEAHRRFAYSYVARDEGAVPRYISRWMLDRAIFARRKRRIINTRTGSMLIDTSGSMDLSTEQIDEFLETFPAAVVATYSGWNSANGTLRVVAQNGRRCEPQHLNTPGGWNVVDYHALRWLELQPEPRFWVSDEHATNLSKCRQVKERANIRATKCPDTLRAWANKERTKAK